MLLKCGLELGTAKDSLFAFDLLVDRKSRLRTRRRGALFNNALVRKVQVGDKRFVADVVQQNCLRIPVCTLVDRPSVIAILRGFLQHYADDASGFAEVRHCFQQGHRRFNFLSSQWFQWMSGHKYVSF